MSGQATALCRRLQQATLERIRADRRRVSVQVARLLAMIEEHLLDPDLTVEALRRWCGQDDKNVSTRFAKEMALTPWSYILQARMELGGRMLAASTLKVWQIGLQVGYDSGHSFGRAFKRWSGKTPTEFRRQVRSAELRSAEAREPEAASPPHPAAKRVLNAELQQGLAGDLSAADASALVARLRGLAGEISDVYQTPEPPVSGLYAIEPVMARKLWQAIEGLPYDVQSSAINSQARAYHTPALFHVLCTESIEAGEDDADRGHQILALALRCLPTVAERLGKSSMYVFARAHAVAGLAFRRSGELDEAAQNLGYASRILDHMGDDAHPAAVAELCLYQALLESDRGNDEMAEQLSDQGVAILVKLGERLLGQLPEADESAGKDAAGPSPEAS